MKIWQQRAETNILNIKLNRNHLKYNSMKTANESLQGRIKELIELLEARFGIPQQQSNPHHLLDGLIRTILSQSTSDVNRDHAYKQLQKDFPQLQLLHRATVTEIEKSIHSAGLYRQKSRRIKEILDWVEKEFGELNIDEICNWSTEKVMEKFTVQKGIGIKSVAVLLLFHCGRDIFPVDTHVHRITRRLHLVAWNASAEKTFYLLDPVIPRDKSYSFHINLLKLGRQICFARNPRHSKCPLYDVCPSREI